tara:strand:- start:22 stop:588 length:567 start_codon:yes stop_codon:yes gene_type:complete
MIKIILFLTFGFASSPINNWFEKNKATLSNEFKSSSFYLEINSDFPDQLNSNSYWVKIFLAGENKFRIDFKNRIVVADKETWRVYDIISNQLFIQSPDKRLEKLLFSLSKIKKMKSFPVKKINNKEYEISFFDKSNKARLFFNYNDDLKYILIINDDLEIKISNIDLKKENSIDLLIGNEDTEIFDLR